jgi:hypothetical protein
VTAEYSSLRIGGRNFWTFCLEGRNQKLLEGIIKKLDMGSGRDMDYINFLSHFSSEAGVGIAPQNDGGAGSWFKSRCGNENHRETRKTTYLNSLTVIPRM